MDKKTDLKLKMIEEKQIFLFAFSILLNGISLSTLGQVIPETNNEVAKKDTSVTTGLIDKIMDVVIVEKENYTFAIFPIIDYGKELGFSMGAMLAIVLKDSNENTDAKYYRPTTIIPSFTYSTNNHLFFNTDLILYTKNNWLIFSKLGIYSVPSNFYGIGTPQSNVSLFNQETYTHVAAFLKSIDDNNYLGITYDIGYVNNLEIEGKILNKNIKGYEGGFHLGLGPRYQFDTRDDILYPSKGILFTLNFKQYFGDYIFHVTSIDYRNYTSLFSEKNILASQISWTISFGDVPFYKLPKLGGKSNLRSINNANKYINNHSYYFQTEYRRQLIGRFGAVLFIGAGSSASGINKEYLEDMVYGYGVGFRFHMLNKDKLNFRIDVGWGDGEPALFITIREAF